MRNLILASAATAFGLCSISMDGVEESPTDGATPPDEPEAEAGDEEVESSDDVDGDEVDGDE